MTQSHPQGINATPLIERARRTARKLLGREHARTRTNTRDPKSDPESDAATAPNSDLNGRIPPDTDPATRAVTAGGAGGESLTDFEKGLLRVIDEHATDPHETADPAGIIDELERSYGNRIPVGALAPALNDLYDQDAIRVSDPDQGAALREANELWSQRAWPEGEEFVLTIRGRDLLQDALISDVRQIGLETHVPNHAPPDSMRMRKGQNGNSGGGEC